MALTEEKLMEQPRTIEMDGVKFLRKLEVSIEYWAEELKYVPLNNIITNLEIAHIVLTNIINDELKNGDYKKAIQKVRIEIE